MWSQNQMCFGADAESPELFPLGKDRHKQLKRILHRRGCLLSQQRSDSRRIMTDSLIRRL